MRMISLAVLSALLIFPSALQAGCKVGIVNMPKLLAEYPEAKAAHSQLMKDAGQRQETVAALGAEIERLTKEYNAGKKTWTEKQRKEKAYVIGKKEEDYEKARNLASSEIEDLQTKAGRIVYDKLKAVIAEVAKESGVDLVLDADQALYARESTDLTEKVMRKFTKSK